MAYDPISDYISTPMHDAARDIGQLRDIVNFNNAQSRAATEDAMAYNRAMMLQSMSFNSAEAARNRTWQEYMSNTAHRREMRDLIAAGLNPVLAANQGATTPSGAAASSSAASSAAANLDQSGASAVAALLQSIVQADASIKNTNVSAITQSNIAEQSRAVSQIIAQMNNSTQKMVNAARISNDRYLGELSAEVAVRNAQVSASATRDAAYASASAMRYSAEQQASASRYAADMNYHNSRDNPSSWAGLANRGVNEFLDLLGMLFDPEYSGKNSYWNSQNPGYLP